MGDALMIYSDGIIGSRGHDLTEGTSRAGQINDRLSAGDAQLRAEHVAGARAQVEDVVPAASGLLAHQPFHGLEVGVGEISG